MSSVTHTFISAINSHSLIDHFILPESLFDCIMIYKQVDSIDNISYHLPVLLHLNCNIDYSRETESVKKISNAFWRRADETQIKIYREHLDMYLSIHFNVQNYTVIHIYVQFVSHMTTS